MGQGNRGNLPVFSADRLAGTDTCGHENCIFIRRPFIERQAAPGKILLKHAFSRVGEIVAPSGPAEAAQYPEKSLPG